MSLKDENNWSSLKVSVGSEKIFLHSRYWTHSLPLGSSIHIPYNYRLFFEILPVKKRRNFLVNHQKANLTYYTVLFFISDYLEGL